MTIKLKEEIVYLSKSSQSTQKIAKDLFNKILIGKAPRIVLLQGQLGAGKTCFCQGFLEAAGAKKPFSSPTFVIRKDYRPARKFQDKIEKIYHWDCYRIKEKDLLILDWQEIIENPHNLILVEWPDKVKKIFSKDFYFNFLKILLKVKGENIREIKIQNFNSN